MKREMGTKSDFHASSQKNTDFLLASLLAQSNNKKQKANSDNSPHSIEQTKSLKVTDEQLQHLLITDYESHMQLLQHMGNSVVARVNLFLTIFSALLGAVIFLVQSNGFDNTTINLVICAVMSIILVIGLLVYAEITQWIIYTIMTNRQLQRIKYYFFENNGDHEKVSRLLRAQLPYMPKRKTFLDIVATDLGSKQIITILNNSLTAAIAIILSITIRGFDARVFVLGVLAFFFIWIIQFLYSRTRYWLAERNSVD